MAVAYVVGPPITMIVYKGYIIASLPLSFLSLCLCLSVSLSLSLCLTA
jgi:hypothetical protein